MQRDIDQKQKAEDEEELYKLQKDPAGLSFLDQVGARMVNGAKLNMNSNKNDLESKRDEKLQDDNDGYEDIYDVDLDVDDVAEYDNLPGNMMSTNAVSAAINESS